MGNPVGEEGYYAMENGGDKIYILASDFVDSINYSLFSLVEKRGYPPAFSGKINMDFPVL